jgi:hypothetical protein
MKKALLKPGKSTLGIWHEDFCIFESKITTPYDYIFFNSRKYELNMSRYNNIFQSMVN